MSNPDDQGQSGQQVTRNVARWWWVVPLVALLCLAGGAASALLPATRYAATVAMVVRISDNAPDTEALVRTAESLTTSSVVLDDVARSSGTGLSVQQVEQRLTVQRSTGSAVIEVVVVDTDRERARTVAEQVVPSLTARLEEIRDSGATAQARPLTVQTFSGGPQLSLVQPPLLRNAAIGLVAGAALGLLVANALGSWRPQRRRPTRRERRRARRQQARDDRAERKDRRRTGRPRADQPARTSYPTDGSD